ncbi:MAG TPA: FAD-binding oxidoreductase [Solirubrobacteraceae bacterium]|nr:FAD-binding oxidoreductase [Solirubrobacteraceae bacterium]
MSGELSISGDVVRAGEPGWDAARAAWNLAADQHPALVAIAQDVHDIAAVVRWAAANDLRVTAQGTGHGAGPLGPLDDTVLIKTERMRGVHVDPAARTARVEAGVLSLELAEAAQAHGLSSLPGSSPDVGVIGFTLGGGLGWLGRRYGLACNRVIAIELVDAAGEQRRIDADTDPGLFWALRGGGGDFAIVTALHIELVELAELFAGTLILPGELGAQALHAWRNWLVEVSEDVTSIARFLHLPPLPEIPEPLRDRPLFTIGAACIGDQEKGERLIAPLRALGEPIMDMFAQIPAAGLARIHMDPEQPVPGLGHHAMLAELPDEAIEAFVGVAGPEAHSPLLLAELRQLGGALAREAADGGALSKLDAAFLLSGVGSPATPELAQAIPGTLDRLHETMSPWASDTAYLNFAERPCDLDAILPAAICARLREVKQRVDPIGTIRGNHSLAVAA